MYRSSAVLLYFGAASLCMAQPGSVELVRKLCGTCHPVERAVAARRTKAQWQETIDKMVLLGAKASDEEFATVLNYLASQYGADAASGRGGRGFGAPVARQFGGAGADDKHVVDDAAADRGRKIWAAECIDCHGTYA